MLYVGKSAPLPSHRPSLAVAISPVCSSHERWRISARTWEVLSSNGSAKAPRRTVPVLRPFRVGNSPPDCFQAPFTLHRQTGRDRAAAIAPLAAALAARRALPDQRGIEADRGRATTLERSPSGSKRWPTLARRFPVSQVGAKAPPLPAITLDARHEANHAICAPDIRGPQRAPGHRIRRRGTCRGRRSAAPLRRWHEAPGPFR